MKIDITLIEEEKPFLVSGFSEITQDFVFGFPYFHKTKSVDGKSKVCPCIILPCADDGVSLPDDGEYDFAVRRGEFHPVKGELLPFDREEKGCYVFKYGIVFPLDQFNP